MIIHKSADFNYTVFFPIIIISLLITACSNGGSSSNNSKNNEIQLKQGKLVEVTDEAELNQFLRKGIQNSFSASTRFAEPLVNGVESGSADLTANDSSSDDSSSKFSGTYTLEANVDEADIVKYDGDYLFVAEQPENFCCTFLDGFAPTQSQVKPALRVLCTDPAEPSATVLTKLTPTVAEKTRLSGLYQKGNILV